MLLSGSGTTPPDVEEPNLWFPFIDHSELEEPGEYVVGGECTAWPAELTADHSGLGLPFVYTPNTFTLIACGDELLTSGDERLPSKCQQPKMTG